MTYFKTIDGPYIISIGTGIGGESITEAEYNQLKDIILNKPFESDTIGYRLKTDLTWEQYTKEPVPEDDEATPEDILAAMEDII